MPKRRMRVTWRVLSGVLGILSIAALTYDYLLDGYVAAGIFVQGMLVAGLLLYAAVVGRGPRWFEALWSRGNRNPP